MIQTAQTENFKTWRRLREAFKNKIKNLLGPPQFYIVTYLLTDRATTRGPGGPKKRGFEGYRV